MFEKLIEASSNLYNAAKEVCDAMVEAFAEIAEVIREKLDEFEGWEEANDDLEWKRAMEREAITREQGKARARYKAHSIMMAQAKSRKHMRCRKQRQYKSMGWY